MKQDKTRWEATGTPGLYVRQPGGGYYARITLNGKRSWRSLKTDKIREAQKLLRDLQSGHTRQVSTRTEDKLHAGRIQTASEYRRRDSSVSGLIASFTLLGISAIGATESAAINAVFDAFKTHNLGSASAPENCEACS